MELKVEATQAECNQFIPQDGAEPQTVSVVIAPLKVILSDDGAKAAITSGCNFYQSCHNPACYYSVTARDAARKATKKAGPAGK